MFLQFNWKADLIRMQRRHLRLNSLQNARNIRTEALYLMLLNFNMWLPADSV
jgi:hypothetical protein